MDKLISMYFHMTTLINCVLAFVYGTALEILYRHERSPHAIYIISSTVLMYHVPTIDLDLLISQREANLSLHLFFKKNKNLTHFIFSMQLGFLKGTSPSIVFRPPTHHQGFKILHSLVTLQFLFAWSST